MDALDPAQIYVGGAASGVACATCSATSTSGSWRKGWAVGPGADAWANLCNRCGQRWAKAGRPTLRPGQELGSRRPDVKDKETAQWAVAHHQKFGRPGYSSPSSDSESSRGNNFFISAHAPEVITGGPVPSSPHQYQSYCLQKLCHQRTQYMLVWVQDARQVSTLAVVGTDARSSGHYTYTKAPDFPGPPLTCTNRARVVSWLAALGVSIQVSEGACILPALSPGSLMQLSEGPRTTTCAWVNIREESVHACGHLSRRFLLINAFGGQALAACSANGSSLYRAEPAFGGALFHSRESLLAWLQSLLSHEESMSLPPSNSNSFVHLPNASCMPYMCQSFAAHTPPAHQQPTQAAVGGKIRPRLPLDFPTLALDALDDLAFGTLSPVTLIHTGDDFGMSCLEDPALNSRMPPHAVAAAPPPLQLPTHFSTPSIDLRPPPRQNQPEDLQHGEQLVSPYQLMHWAQILTPSTPGTPPLQAATALPILSELSTCTVDLAALDSTDLSRAVSALRRHPDVGVAHMAGRVASRWRSSALSVLHQSATPTS